MNDSSDTERKTKRTTTTGAAINPPVAAAAGTEPAGHRNLAASYMATQTGWRGDKGGLQQVASANDISQSSARRAPGGCSDYSNLSSARNHDDAGEIWRNSEAPPRASSFRSSRGPAASQASDPWQLSIGSTGGNLSAQPNKRTNATLNGNDEGKLSAAAAEGNEDGEKAECPRFAGEILKSLLKMAKRNFLITILGLSLIVLACLLASVAISRSIGGRELNADNSEAGGQRLAPGQLRAEPLEERELEVVDLIECDKTFAYARWKVRVQVPKSTPIYKQHHQPPERSDGATRRVRHVTNAKDEETKSGERGDEPGEYHLVGTREFVAEHEQHAAPSMSAASESEPQREFETAASEQTDLTADNQLDDPLELAASEMHVNSSTLNPKLVDCFLVDIEKRLEQKRALEARHSALTTTRLVPFKSMLAVIQACRELTIRSLSSTEPSTSSNRDKSTAISSQVDQRQRRATIATSPRPDQRFPQEPNSDRGDERRVLNQIIWPSNRAPTQTAPNNQTLGSSFGSIFEALFSGWSGKPSTTESSQGGSESERNSKVVPMSGLQPGSMVALARNVTRAQLRELPARLAADTTPSNGDDDEEAKRRASYLNMGMSMMSGIVPNTLWCGLGDRATNYSELGAEYQVDACCRAHDHCPIRLKPFAADYNLINWSMSTRSHCDCDLDFGDCLTTVNSSLSNIIKTLYFRFVGLQCIDLETSLAAPPEGTALLG